MRFEVDQPIAAPIDDVAAAFADPAYYESLGQLPKLGTPEVLHHDVRGDVVHIQVRYRFTGDLNSAVTAVIDPKKLSWVEHATHDLAARTARYELAPDHYPDRLRCSGGSRYSERSSGTVRHIAGDLKVRAPLVAGLVEKAIVSGLREHLEAEAGYVERFLRARAG